MCKIQAKTDELQFAKSRLSSYQGLASEAYIAIDSIINNQDPILKAFKLGKTLVDVAHHEPHFKVL